MVNQFADMLFPAIARTRADEAASSLKVIADSDRFEDELRRKAIKTLGYLSGQIESLVSMLEYVNLRGAVREALVTSGAEAVEPLCKIVQDEQDQRLACVAAGALGELGDERAVEPVISFLGKPREVPVYLEAISALGKLGTPKSLPPLIEALSHRDKLIRGAAARGLGDIADPAATESLMTALKVEQEIFPRSQIVEALEKIQGKPPIADHSRVGATTDDAAAYHSLFDRMKEITNLNEIARNEASPAAVILEILDDLKVLGLPSNPDLKTSYYYIVSKGWFCVGYMDEGLEIGERGLQNNDPSTEGYGGLLAAKHGTAMMPPDIRDVFLNFKTQLSQDQSNLCAGLLQAFQSML